MIELKLKRPRSKNGKFNRHAIYNKYGNVPKLGMHKNPLGYCMDVNDLPPYLDLYKFIDSYIGKDYNKMFSKLCKLMRKQSKFNTTPKQAIDWLFAWKYGVDKNNKIIEQI